MKLPVTRSIAPRLLWRGGGALVIASLTLPMLGCGSPAPQTPPPPVQDAPGTAPRMAPQANTNTGMSTATKVKILAGAAAAYYLYNRYKKSQAAKAAPQNVQYYLSKSTGRIYYRDPQTKQAHFVTPPQNQIQPIQVPTSEAAQYQRFRGYENQQTGDTVWTVPAF